MIRVRTSLKRLAGQGRAALQPAGLKTEAGHRTLKMPAATRAALVALKREQAADRLRPGEHYADDGLVFCDTAGRAKWPQEVRAGFRVRCKRAGLSDDWQPRELRHTFVSQLSAKGVLIEDIADAAGHVNANVTPRHVPA